MVFSFFRGGDSGLEHVERHVNAMLNDCRHSFDVAMGALLTDADIGPLGEDVRSTDVRINRAEEKVRRELVVHSSVHGGSDSPVVLTYLLIVKKLERVGDQAKNIFDLADEGVRFSDADDYDRFIRYREEISRMFVDAAAILLQQDAPGARRFLDGAQALMDEFDDLVNDLINSDTPASYAVPRALLWRYLKRICANVASAVSTVVETLDHSEYPGAADLDE